MKVTKAQLMNIIKEELATMEVLSPEDQRAVTQDMDAGIAREFAEDVVHYIRENVISEQAPALAAMNMREFLNLVADIGGDERMAQPYRGAGAALEEDEKWIQDAEKDIEKRGTEGVCTGDKFGGPTCRPGTKRYNLAKTFRKMAKKRKKS